MKKDHKNHKTPENSFFKVPDGYFEDLPSKIQMKTSQAGEVRNSYKFRLWPYLAPAFVLMLLLGVYIFTPEKTFRKDLHPSETTANLAQPEKYITEISKPEVLSYLDNIDQHEEMLLIELTVQSGKPLESLMETTIEISDENRRIIEDELEYVAPEDLDLLDI